MTGNVDAPAARSHGALIISASPMNGSEQFPPRALYTWGYQGRSYDDLRGVVREHGITQVFDVRRSARSRDPRWCDWNLCKEPDFALLYETLYGELGNANHAKRGEWVPLDASKATAWIEFLGDYDLLHGGHALLMCMERRADDCHRKIVAELVSARHGCEVIHL